MIVICTVCDAEAACCDDSRTLVPGARGAGEVVRVSLHNGSTSTVAKGLSCPEGVALDDLGFLYVVENPVGDECQAEFPTKKAAQLTRIDLRSGAQTRVAGLRSSTTGEEGGPSSHTQTHVRVSICAARTLLKSHRSAQDPPMAAVRARVTEHPVGHANARQEERGLRFTQVYEPRRAARAGCRGRGGRGVRLRVPRGRCCAHAGRALLRRQDGRRQPHLSIRLRCRRQLRLRGRAGRHRRPTCAREPDGQGRRSAAWNRAGLRELGYSIMHMQNSTDAPTPEKSTSLRCSLH